MSLDIRLFRIKNSETWDKYLKSCRKLEEFTNELWHTYQKETDEAHEKWEQWNREHDPSEEDNPYFYMVTDFANEKELERFTELERQKDYDLKDTWYEEQPQLNCLSNQYWFAQFAYSCHPELMIEDHRFKEKVLDTDKWDKMLLTRNDMFLILGKLEFIKNQDTLSQQEALETSFPPDKNFMFWDRMSPPGKEFVKKLYSKFLELTRKMGDDELILYEEWW